MALRFLLVSLVAGMGLDLPSGQELSSWTRAGRERAGARMASLSTLRVEAERAFLGANDCERAADEVGPIAPSTADSGPSTADLAFDVVVEGMASDFAADLAATRVDRPESEFPAEVLVEQPRGQAPPVLAWTDPEPELAPTPSPVEPRPSTPAAVPAPAGRAERLSVAVRLTRQAVGAWVLLLEGSSEILTDAR